MTSENCKTGLTVGRGRDWVWDNQDHINGNKVTGTITLCNRKEGRIAKVRWDGERTNIQRAYRIGADGAFDLAIKGIKNSMRIFIFTKLKTITNKLCHL